MRIISGTARGTKLFTLEGQTTRPTLDRVKESLFNIIQNKYEKNINKKYEVDENEFYEKILEEYQILNNV